MRYPRVATHRVIRSSDVRGRYRFALLLIPLVAAIACGAAVRPTAASSVRPTVSDTPFVAPAADPSQQRALATGDPLRCTQRAALPQLNDVFEAEWSPDSRTLALSRITTIPSDTTITGTEEDQRLVLVDLASGSVTERGVGSEPKWSASGTYLSYWIDQTTLWIVKKSSVLPVAVLKPTEPNVQWVGDQLLFFSGALIDEWENGSTRTIASVEPNLAPRYPRDDVYFSADGQRFTLTRYSTQAPGVQRYLGSTKTGFATLMDDGGATFMEWSPVGETLLFRSSGALSLRAADTGATLATVATPPGSVHQWLPDGRLLLGTMSPTVPAGNAFDRFGVLGEASAAATLPNLLGIRAFSPDGQFFLGAARTGLYSTELQLFRCGVREGEDSDIATDPATKARAARIAADTRRFVRPAAAAITQYLQGIHTGIDVAAPYGTVIVAADDGVVDAVGFIPTGGRRVCVLHAGGLESCDYHTALPLVALGDHVVRGQPLALMGLTGVTTGPHVHWEAKRDDAIVDPLKQ